MIPWYLMLLQLVPMVEQVTPGMKQSTFVFTKDPNIKVIIPWDQCVIPHRAQASTLPEEENYTVFVEDLLRFP